MTNNRFAVAIHILSLIELFKDRPVTSEFIAGSVNTNAVVIRRIMGSLNKAGIIRTSPGVPGAELARPADEITLLDVYKAIAADKLFAVHEKPSPACPVGRNIQSSLEAAFDQAQSAMEQRLADMTLEHIAADLKAKL